MIATAGEEGAALSYFAPWNEPNHPAFVSPQRPACDPAAPSAAPAAYAQLATAMQQALAKAPGDQQLVLGETAGLMKSTRYVTSVPDFIAGLPKTWSARPRSGPSTPISAATTPWRRPPRRSTPSAARTVTIWITETGVGPRPRPQRGRSISDAAAGCRALHAQLVRWYDDPRVTIAFQYTVREDDKFPTGLVSTDLTKDRPALNEWTAWGGARTPTPRPHPPPAHPERT